MLNWGNVVDHTEMMCESVQWIILLPFFFFFMRVCVSGGLTFRGSWSA